MDLTFLKIIIFMCMYKYVNLVLYKSMYLPSVYLYVFTFVHILICLSVKLG